MSRVAFEHKRNPSRVMISLIADSGSANGLVALLYLSFPTGFFVLSPNYTPHMSELDQYPSKRHFCVCCCRVVLVPMALVISLWMMEMDEQEFVNSRLLLLYHSTPGRVLVCCVKLSCDLLTLTCYGKNKLHISNPVLAMKVALDTIELAKLTSFYTHYSRHWDRSRCSPWSIHRRRTSL